MRSEKIFHADVDPHFLTVYAIFLGKVTRNKKDKDKRNPPRNTLSFKFCYLNLKFRSMLSLIMQINGIRILLAQRMKILALALLKLYAENLRLRVKNHHVFKTKGPIN